MITIRTKFLLLILSILVVASTCYLLLASQLFTRDKTAYVYDQAATTVGQAAQDMNAELQLQTKNVQLVLQMLQAGGAKVNVAAWQQTLFRDSTLLALTVFEGQERRLQLFNPDDVTRLELDTTVVSEQLNALPVPAEAMQLSDTIIEPISLGKGLTVLNLWIPAPGEKSTFALATLNIESHVKRLTAQAAFRTFALNQRGDVIAGDVGWMQKAPTYLQAIATKITALKAPSGAFEASDEMQTSRIVAYQTIAANQLYYVADIKQDDAFFAAKILLEKSAFFALLVLGFALISSVLFTKRLTGTLSSLFNATQKVAKGDFNIDLNVKSNDEVETLANSFNTMAQEIQRLLVETREKARMEKELETAQLVQDNFFPPENLEVGQLKLCSHFKPATECGGDWWGLLRVGRELIVLIGDATGHGVPAALMTAAAHACLATLAHTCDKQQQVKLTPAVILSYLNDVIKRAGKGKMKMSFFVAMINVDEAKIRYASAGHPLPLCLRVENQDRTVTALDAEVNELLGASNAGAFKEGVTNLKVGDVLVLYTDGLVEANNEQGEEWGEGRLIRLLKKTEIPLTAREIRKRVAETHQAYTKSLPRQDDITFVVISYAEKVATRPLEGAA